jgi:hypothetical protein
MFVVEVEVADVSGGMAVRVGGSEVGRGGVAGAQAQSTTHRSAIVEISILRMFIFFSFGKQVKGSTI